MGYVIKFPLKKITRQVLQFLPNHATFAARDNIFDLIT
jgi:hypothetical protein